jgi:hypothetical protein
MRAFPGGMRRRPCSNNHLLVITLVFVAVFLLGELVLRIYDLYRHEPLVDVPSHFFAGIAICLAALHVMTLTSSRWRKRASVLITLAAAVFWEILETLEELVVENPPYLRDIFFWDGFWDIIVTTLGGLFALVILAVIRRTTDLDPRT